MKNLILLLWKALLFVILLFINFINDWNFHNQTGRIIIKLELRSTMFTSGRLLDMDMEMLFLLIIFNLLLFTSWGDDGNLPRLFLLGPMKSGSTDHKC